MLSSNHFKNIILTEGLMLTEHIEIYSGFAIREKSTDCVVHFYFAQSAIPINIQLFKGVDDISSL